MESGTCGLHGTVHVSNIASSSTCRGSVSDWSSELCHGLSVRLELGAVSWTQCLTGARSCVMDSVSDWSSELCRGLSQLCLSLTGPCMSSSHAVNSSVHRRGTFE